MLDAHTLDAQQTKQIELSDHLRDESASCDKEWDQSKEEKNGPIERG